MLRRCLPRSVLHACDTEAINDPLGTHERLSMLGFLHIMKKCNVPHPDVPMSAFDRIFVEVNWTSDPPVRNSADQCSGHNQPQSTRHFHRAF